MPLHANAEGMTNRFQPLNDAIGRAGGDGKSCSHGFDRLVVGTVHTQLASPDQRGQPAARRHLDRRVGVQAREPDLLRYQIA